MIARFSIDGWRAAAFAGFVPLLTLDVSRVPAEGGVYAVLRGGPEPPTFTAISSGGHFKGKNPAVGTDVIAAKWVDGVHTVYVGKATNLRKRLGQFRDFGRGRAIGHWGGRYLWQLADSSELVVCWTVTIDEPRDAERTLLREFATIHGRRPFANLIG